MKFTPHRMTAPLLGLATTALTATAAMAEQPTHTELLARIEALEADQAGNRPDLGFNIAPNTVLTIYGFVRAEAFYDFDFEQGDLSGIGSLSAASTATDGTFDTSVRVSRLGFRVSSDTDIGTFGGQLEYDLFGGEGRSELRLRHANVTLNGWLVGQSWTNFMPIGQYPSTSDFNGPVGITFARVPQVRYSGSAGDFNYAVSIEQSAWASRDPVLTVSGSYATDFFTIRGAALTGTIENGADDLSVSGYTLTGQARPWDGGQFTVNYTAGDGISGLFIGGGGNAAVVGGATNEVSGYTVEFTQAIGDNLSVGAAYGFEDYDVSTATTTDEVESLHLTAFYSVTDRARIGLEYITGERTFGDGSSLEADRIGASFTFSF